MVVDLTYDNILPNSTWFKSQSVEHILNLFYEWDESNLGIAQ